LLKSQGVITLDFKVPSISHLKTPRPIRLIQPPSPMAT